MIKKQDIICKKRALKIEYIPFKIAELLFDII